MAPSINGILSLLKGGKRVTSLPSVSKALRQEVRSQQYYDDLAREWMKGKTCFNPRTGNSTHIDLSRGGTYVFKGNVGENGIVNGKLVNHEGINLMRSVKYGETSNYVTITERLPGRNLWPTFTQANSTSRQVYCG